MEKDQYILKLPLWATVSIGCALVEGLSFFAWHVPQAAPVFIIVLGLLALVAALRDARTGFLILLAESVIGAHGHLLACGPASLRMVLFAAAIVGWAFDLLRTRGWARLKTLPLLAPLAAVAGAVLWGAVRGLWLGRGTGAIVADANAYAFILLVPMALDLFRDAASLRRVGEVFMGAILWLSAKALLALSFFGHASGPIFDDIRLWQRKFGLLEVTPSVPSAWHRIFSASDLFLVPAVAFGAHWLGKLRDRQAWLVVLPAAALVACWSRSFWLGFLVGSIAVFPFLKRMGFRTVLRVMISVGTISLLILAAAVWLPPPSRIGVTEALAARLSGTDAAITSRGNLLKPLETAIAAHPLLGNGFGATVTYRSDDPRIQVLYPGGVITTGAIEFQYLEIWLKMGLSGLIAIGWLLAAILKIVLSAAKKDSHGFSAAVLLSFVAFIVLNIFTPYINHPLGWMYLALIAAVSRSRPDTR